MKGLFLYRLHPLLVSPLSLTDLVETLHCGQRPTVFFSGLFFTKPFAARDRWWNPDLDTSWTSSQMHSGVGEMNRPARRDKPSPMPARHFAKLAKKRDCFSSIVSPKTPSIGARTRRDRELAIFFLSFLT
jgi:hypothetical protein